MSLTKEQCIAFSKDDTVNPITKRKIQRNKSTWAKFVKQCEQFGIRVNPPAPAATPRLPSVQPLTKKTKVQVMQTVSKNPKGKQSKHATTLEDVCEAFSINDRVNPRTGRKITPASKIYKQLTLECAAYRETVARRHMAARDEQKSQHVDDVKGMEDDGTTRHPRDAIPRNNNDSRHAQAPYTQDPLNPTRVRLMTNKYTSSSVPPDPFITECVKVFPVDIQQSISKEMRTLYAVGLSVLHRIPMEPYMKAYYSIAVYYIIAKYVLAYDYEITTDYISQATLSAATNVGITITKQQLIEYEQKVFPLVLPYITKRTKRNWVIMGGRSSGLRTNPAQPEEPQPHKYILMHQRLELIQHGRLPAIKSIPDEVDTLISLTNIRRGTQKHKNITKYLQSQLHNVPLYAQLDKTALVTYLNHVNMTYKLPPLNNVSRALTNARSDGIFKKIVLSSKYFLQEFKDHYGMTRLPK